MLRYILKVIGFNPNMEKFINKGPKVRGPFSFKTFSIKLLKGIKLVSKLCVIGGVWFIFLNGNTRHFPHHIA